MPREGKGDGEGGAVNSLISMKSFVRMATTQVIILKVRQVPDSVQSSPVRNELSMG